MFTYDGNEKETYTIFKDGNFICEVNQDEDTVMEIVEFLNGK